MTSSDVIKRHLIVDNFKITITYIETLINTYKLDKLIIEKLESLKKERLKDLSNSLANENIKIINKNEINKYLYNSFVIIETDWKIYALELRENLNRSIQTINGEISIIGPKDSFIENYNTNIGLIRKRIPNEKVIVETLKIGTLTATKVGILSIKGITSEKLIKRIKKQLQKIYIDGLIDSSYIKRNLETKGQLFPTIIPTERPDKAVMQLLEGKVLIVVDNSPYVLILPSFFIDFFHTVDDYYQKSTHISFIRIIRFFAFLIAILTPAIYIAITTRNYDLVPLDLLLMLKAGRTFVPFPAYLEAIFMIICFEILKESDIRMSSTNGSAVSILGGLILGDAAVAAGIVSPIMIIVIAISSMAALVFSSIEFVNVIRFYKVLLLLLGSCLGIVGIIIGIVFLLYNLINTKCFDYKYLIPIYPLDKNELKDTIIRIDDNNLYRNSKITKNKYRGKIR